MSSYRGSRPRQVIHSAYCALILIVAVTSVASAQQRPAPNGPTGSVTGRVVRSDGPKYGVHVIDQETWMSVTTRPDGTFSLGQLPVGRHVFRIGSEYCEVQLVPVAVFAGQVTTLEVQLTCKPRPCPVPDRADSTCILENPEQRARAGTRCEVHRRTKLKLDLVPVHHDIVGHTPGLGGDERAQFPNARPWYSAGCVVWGIPFAEVAYCTECRAVWKLAIASAKLRHLQRDR